MPSIIHLIDEKSITVKEDVNSIWSNIEAYDRKMVKLTGQLNDEVFLIPITSISFINPLKE